MRERAFDSGSPVVPRHDATTSIAFQREHTLGDDHQWLNPGSHPLSHYGHFRDLIQQEQSPEKEKTAELNTIQGSTASRHLSSSQSFLCTLQRATSETSPA